MKTRSFFSLFILSLPLIILNLQSAATIISENGELLNLSQEQKDIRLIEAIKMDIREDQRIFQVQSFINEGSNVNAIDTSGQSVLMVAVTKQKKDIINLLLKAGANINFTNRYKYTALMLLSRMARKEIVQLLLDAGANLDNCNGYGHTALMIAKSTNCSKDVIKLLEDEPRRRALAKFRRILSESLINNFFPKTLSGVILSYLPNELQEYIDAANVIN